MTINFTGEKDLPPTSISLGTTRFNRTGSWRSQRPKYLNKTPPCNYHCPAGEDIVEYLALTADGLFEEAWRLIMEENPLPGVTGRVCPHPCENECNRSVLGGEIAIHNIERFLADKAAEEGYRLPSPEKKKSKRIAVVGSGPAGLSCSYHLARMGYQVTIFEASEKPGGMMRLIPDYRLPREVLDREIAVIVDLGVRIETKRKLGENLKMEELRKHDAIFLAVGQSQSIELKIPGEESKGVLPGIDFLAQIDHGEKTAIGKRVVVIGGGNTAMDASRTACRLGSEVTILYRRTKEEMPANDEEIEEAQDEGVKIEYLVSPVEIRSKKGKVAEIRCIRMRLGEPDESGRRRPVPIKGSEFDIPCDTVIPALGQSADLSFLGDEVRHESGRIGINEASQTTDQKVFAGGDVATGFGTVTHAVGSGKRAAIAIDRFFTGVLGDFPSLNRNVTVHMREMEPIVVKAEDLNMAYVEEMIGPDKVQLPPGKRIKNFSEVNVGLTEEAATEEARRCFSCGTCKECDNCLIFCPDVSVLRGKETPYEFDYEYCKGCGICAEECPTKSIKMIEEVR